MNALSDRAISFVGSRASNSACPAEYVRDGKLPALYRTSTPRAVRSAGGPPSTSQESKNPARDDSTFTARPSGPTTRVQSSRLSHVAISTTGTPEYHHYIALTAFTYTHTAVYPLSNG